MSNRHDVNTYMEIRWYINAIENLALSAYAGYPHRKNDIMCHLKSAAKALEMLGKGTPVAAAGTAQAGGSTNETKSFEITPRGDCPWQTCEDGSCRPSCTIRPT